MVPYEPLAKDPPSTRCPLPHVLSIPVYPFLSYNLGASHSTLTHQLQTLVENLLGLLYEVGLRNTPGSDSRLMGVV